MTNYGFTEGVLSKHRKNEREQAEKKKENKEKDRKYQKLTTVFQNVTKNVSFCRDLMELLVESVSIKNNLKR